MRPHVLQILTRRKPLAFLLGTALLSGTIANSTAQNTSVRQGAIELGPLIGLHHGPERVARGERSTAATQMLTTARRAGMSAAIPERGDPQRGTFSPVLDWPLVPIHAVLTLDGRVLTYGTDENGKQGASLIYDVWDPLFGAGPEAHKLLPNRTAVDVFCGAQLTLPDGNIGLFGGDNFIDGRTTNTPNPDITQFNLADDSLTRLGTMHRPRWYASAITLPNNEILIQGGLGGADYPEIRATDGSYRLMTNIPTGNLSWFYPRNFLAPDGSIFGFSESTMYQIGLARGGSIRTIGQLPGDNIGNKSTAVMFEPGRILQLGGGRDADQGSNGATIIDLNRREPRATQINPMQYPRQWANATVLADGKVLVSGGSRVANADADVAYTTELYDPRHGDWREGATAAQMRLYHSMSLLLPDGTVLTGGGGVPGPQRNLNVEIYYPPYLFNRDGSRATRPRIDSAPMSISPGKMLTFSSKDAHTLRRVALVKTGSVTHSFDVDQRFIELFWFRIGDTVMAWLNDDRNQFPPGTYMLFALNRDGTPSEASILRINPRR